VSGGITDYVDVWSSTNAGTFIGGPGTTSDRPNRNSQTEMQWSHQRSTRQRFVFGSELRHNKSQQTSFDLSNYADRSTHTASTSFATGQSLNQAVYAQDEISITENLSAVVGGRYDYWHSYSGQSRTATNGPTDIFPARTAHAFTGKAALVYTAPGRWILRASMGNAFRGPLAQDLFRSTASSNGMLTLANPDLKPEKMISWEVGFRKRLLDRVELEATYYDNHITDLIFTANDYSLDPSGLIRKKFNAGRARTRGVEVAFRQRLFSWLQTQEAWTFSDSRIGRNPLFPESEGKRVPNVPRNLASFMMLADYRAWTGSVGGRYVSGSFGTETNAETTFGVPQSYSPFFEMELSGGYNFKRGIAVFASIQNLLDREYYQFYRSQGRTVLGGIRFRMGGR
jgi:iron complex outermembrane recepter protein